MTTEEIIKRLRDACVGHPHARIQWPHRLLHDAADRLEELSGAAPSKDRKPLPCPFCGCTELFDGTWCLDDGEHDAYECSRCFAGAPVDAWNRREA